MFLMLFYMDMKIVAALLLSCNLFLFSDNFFASVSFKKSRFSKSITHLKFGLSSKLLVTCGKIRIFFVTTRFIPSDETPSIWDTSQLFPKYWKMKSRDETIELRRSQLLSVTCFPDVCYVWLLVEIKNTLKKNLCKNF